MMARRDGVTSALAAGASAASPGHAAALPGAAPSLSWEQTESFRGTVTKQVALRYLVWMPEPAAEPAGGWPLVISAMSSARRGRRWCRFGRFTARAIPWCRPRPTAK